MSRTRTRRRSRSGCQVRTTTASRRAVARQSMLRTSSPTTYSRSESNSVPCPRTRTAERPSSCRSRASRLGRCLREVNGGNARMAPATATERCRPARPRGPRLRIVTRSACRSPRRVGCRTVVTRVRSPATEHDRVALAPGAGRGLPGVPDHRAQPAGRGVGQQQRARPGSAEPHRGHRLAGDGQPAGAERQQRIDADEDQRGQPPQPHGEQTGGEDHRHQPQQEQQRHPPGQRHRTRPGAGRHGPAVLIGGRVRPRGRWRARSPRRLPPARPRDGGSAGARGWSGRAP